MEKYELTSLHMKDNEFIARFGDEQNHDLVTVSLQGHYGQPPSCVEINHSSGRCGIEGAMRMAASLKEAAHVATIVEHARAEGKPHNIATVLTDCGFNVFAARCW